MVESSYNEEERDSFMYLRNAAATSLNTERDKIDRWSSALMFTTPLHESILTEKKYCKFLQLIIGDLTQVCCSRILSREHLRRWLLILICSRWFLWRCYVLLDWPGFKQMPNDSIESHQCYLQSVSTAYDVQDLMMRRSWYCSYSESTSCHQLHP